MNAAATFSEAQARAASPGSRILTEWKAQRDSTRGLRNDVTDSNFVISGDSTAMLQMMGTNVAAAGVTVTPESAMRVSSVFACVQRIGGAIAAMSLKQYERLSGGKRRPVPDMPLWYLLNEQPVDRYTAASHWEGVAASILLRGDGFTYVGRNRMGEIKELIPLPWSSVIPTRKQTATSDRLQYSINDGMRTWGADQDDMLHFPGFGFNGLRGMSVIQWAARNAAGNAMAMDEYSGKYFAGGAHPSIVLETANKMSDALIATTRDTFSQRYSGVDNAHKLPLILTEGLKAAPLSLSAEDSQLLEARKFQVVDIARAFGVPPHMIGETSGSTSWGTGIEAMNRGFVTYTLNAHLVRIQQELNRKLFRSAQYFVEFDRAELLKGDSQGQAKYFRAALGGPGAGPGWMTPDQVREENNQEPMGGRASEIYFPPEKPVKADGTDTTDDDKPESE